MRRLRVRPATACSWASAASRWPCPTRRRRSSPTTRPATPSAPPCSRTPTRVHKVTILPIGHGPRRHPAAPGRGAPHLRPGLHRGLASSSRMGGRIAEELVFGVMSTGANNDLVGSTELARKMVREWGMSRPHRPDGLGLAGRGVPRRGPHAHPRLLRRDRPGDRRRGRADPARAGGALPRRCSPSTATASTSWPARCSSTRRSTAPRSTGS